MEERAGLGNMDVFGSEKGRLLLLSSFSEENSVMDGFTIDADSGSDKDIGGEDWGYGGYDIPLECMKIDSSDFALDLVIFEEPYSDCRKMLLDDNLNISRWVKYRIGGSNNLVRLPLNCHEKLCIHLLLKLEREMKATKLWYGDFAGAHHSVKSKAKGVVELRNLISSVNYEMRYCVGDSSRCLGF